MPFIDCKLTQKLTDEKKEALKTELGKAVSIIGKPESYLMIGISDGYDLYFAGKKMNSGAYVSVSLFGSASGNAYNEMTAAICNILKRQLGIDGSSVYVTYHGVNDWGWNGGNF
ncbi:MAG: hypothetical protein K2N33_00630 [Clostridia bacterium]|nr:hypothetical protein [Clostridia bacterium]